MRMIWIVFIWLLSVKIDPGVAGKCRVLASTSVLSVKDANHHIEAKRKKRTRACAGEQSKEACVSGPTKPLLMKMTQGWKEYLLKMVMMSFFG